MSYSRNRYGSLGLPRLISDPTMELGYGQNAAKGAGPKPNSGGGIMSTLSNLFGNAKGAVQAYNTANTPQQPQYVPPSSGGGGMSTTTMLLIGAAVIGGVILLKKRG